MQKYIAFLRGINVGNIRIKMSDLQTAFETSGFKNVKTYLQTGNVVFDGEKKIEKIKAILEKNLTQTFDYEAFVLIYFFEDLAKIIEKYPFERNETHHDYVIFVEKNSILEELKTLVQAIEEESKHIFFGEKVIYWKVAKGESLSSPFAKIIGKAKYKSTTTTRNINTLEKML